MSIPEKEFKERQISKITLQELRFRLHKHIGAYSLRSIDVKSLSTEMARDAAYQISIKILGQSNIRKYDVPIDIPASWWQHFKQDVFPAWLLEKFPVKKTTHIRTVEFDHMALVPKWDQFPKGQEVVVFTQPRTPGIKESQ
jgi:hypothetical protein